MQKVFITKCGSLRRKLPNRYLPVTRRSGFGQNLTADEQIKLGRAKNLLLFSLVMKKRHSKSKFYDLISRIAITRYIRLKYAPDVQIDSKPDKLRNISFFGIECKNKFRFEAIHLQEICGLLNNFGARQRRKGFCCVLSNGITMPAEEILLRGLFELRSGDIKYDIADVFGRDISAQTRAFGFFIDYVYDNYKHLVHNNLRWWYENDFWAKSAAAIEKRMKERYKFATRNLVSHFIDCNCLETSVVGGGPAEPGANAARWSEEIQKSFYNGWKSINGMKHQTGIRTRTKFQILIFILMIVDNAYGMTEDLYGPTSLRRNDTILLRESEINDRFASLQAGNPEQFIMMGDSAYKRNSHLTSYKQKGDNVSDYVKWNKSMKHVRISVEWNYGTTASLFSYVRRPEKMKILGSDKTSKIYTVATLFKNFHAALYGCQTSKYFDLPMPRDMLSHYVNQTKIEW